MDVHRKCIIFLTTYLLLTGCLCTQPTRSHRQKRGIMKMMMHIMWDPVRLIRYWYAYDVTKEIAKSWRKILPTILLLPVTKNSPHSYNGIAKYVHPTVGFKGSKKNVNYLNTPIEPHYQKSAGSIKSVVVPPKSIHQGLPFPYAFLPEFTQQHYANSKEITDHNVQHDYNNLSPVILGQVPYGDSEKEHIVAHYYMKDSNSKEHKISAFDRDITFTGQHDSIAHDHISSSPSQHVPRAKKKRPGYMSHSESHIHYVPHIGSQRPVVHDDSEKMAPLVLQPGQEFHVVLHPIPVSDFHPNALKPSSEGHELQFVPVHPQSKATYDFNSPILFKAVSGNPAESSTADGHHGETHFPDVRDSDQQIDRSESSAETNILPSNTRYNATGVGHKSKKNSSRRKDLEGVELSTDGTIRRVLSIHKFPAANVKPKKNCSLEDESEVRKTFGLHRYNINMKQLREDLKHGTPVLIPFNKNAYTPSSTADTKATGNQPVTTHRRVIGASTEKSHVQNEHSNEHSGERENSQRLILFLKKNNS